MSKPSLDHCNHSVTLTIVTVSDQACTCLNLELLLLPAAARRPLRPVQVDGVGRGLQHDLAHKVLPQLEAEEDAAAEGQLQGLS